MVFVIKKSLILQRLYVLLSIYKQTTLTYTRHMESIQEHSCMVDQFSRKKSPLPKGFFFSNKRNTKQLPSQSTYTCESSRCLDAPKLSSKYFQNFISIFWLGIWLMNSHLYIIKRGNISENMVLFV